MRRQLSQQAEELLGHSALIITTERVDDVALLLGQMRTMGWPEILDRHRPRHGPQRGRRWGGTAGIGLAQILTEGDHRKVAGAVDIQGRPQTLSRLTAHAIQPLDGSADRLRPLLTHLSKPPYWHQIERDWHARSLAGQVWPAEVLRCDAPTVSGAHEGPAEGLRQLGQRKDDPTRPQRKVMRGSLDPLGMPLAPEGLSGERAEEGFALTRLERIRPGVQTTGLRCVGACTMSAWQTRASIGGHPDW
jgi:transposase